MARLFITARELNFISDITKEIIRDVNAQKIYYYPISEVKTQAHPVYAEAIKKVFDQPIIIEALVDNNFQADTKTNKFGVDVQFKIEVYIQYRDLLEKGVNVVIGDYFSFADVFYEITERNILGNIYGQAEHKDGVRLVGTKVRESQFKALTLGPTDISRPEGDAVQKTFEQTRGQAENSEGPTGDVRDLVKAGVLDPPLSGPRQVSEKGGSTEDANFDGSAFYDDE
jgi:hypothetical protein